MTIQTKIPKLHNIVVLRSFAIITVVLYHCYCPWMNAWNWVETPVRDIYSYVMEVMLVGRMPLFVFVSGYLFSHLYFDRNKYHDFIGFINNKFKRLLIPCFLFTGLMAICLGDNYFNLALYDGYHLWFLKMLFWCFITAWFTINYIKWGVMALMLFLALIMMFFQPLPILGINQYFKYYFFFFGGTLFYRYKSKLSFIYSHKFGSVIILSYVCICAIVLLRYIAQPKITGGDIIHLDKVVAICRHILRPLTVLMAFILVDYLLKKKDGFVKHLDSINNLSYGIYLFHMLLIRLVGRYFLSSDMRYILSEHYLLSPLILFCIVFFTSAFISSILHKTCWGKWLIG